MHCIEEVIEKNRDALLKASIHQNIDIIKNYKS